MKPTLYQIAVGLFNNHVDGCLTCHQAKWTGHYCEEGIQLSQAIPYRAKREESNSMKLSEVA